VWKLENKKEFEKAMDEQQEQTAECEMLEEEFAQTEAELEAEAETSERDSRDIEIQELKNSLQRLQADFINFRRRVEKEKDQISVFANEKILTELLPVIDNLERALISCAEHEKESSVYSGVELVLRQMIDILGKFGLEKIDATDCEFDPNVHHAVMNEEREDVEAGIVVEVFQHGYKLSDKVIRPSMVKVSK